MEPYLIGIDPDIDKNGVAVYWKNQGQRRIDLHSLKFFELMDFLTEQKNRIKLVVIEAGWLNAKSNFRNTKGFGANAKIGKNVGANHEVGKKIVEMCEHLGITHKIVKPLKKTWGGQRREDYS